MNPSTERIPWRLLGQPLALGGFAFGSRYPGVVLRIAGSALPAEQLSSIERLLHTALPQLAGFPASRGAVDEGDDGSAPTIEWMLSIVHRVQIAAGLPIYERGRVFSSGRGTAGIFVPMGRRGVATLLKFFRLLFELMALSSGQEGVGECLSRITAVFSELERESPTGSNVPRFLRAAHALGMPFQELPGQLHLFGEGRHGRWLDSSFTDETSLIGGRIARNKLQAAAFLRMAGIPVPAHRAVVSADAALAAADELGYPVVVKPADLDGGVAVAADLLSAEEVVAAFKAAREKSANILVEKHFAGRDYRLTVFHDEVIWAIERVPGGVTGDGRHTVAALVEQLNADPQRGEGRHSPLKRLLLDEEAVALLRRAGLSPSSVPAAGRFVRLRRAANVASGGTPVAVMDRIHPDNRLLAIRAARALRLDLAGVDLLIPDISLSWRESGAAICEVNGQPHLGQSTAAHLYAEILRKLVPGGGRVPTVVVLGAPAASKLVSNLESRLLQNHVVAGCHDAAGVRVNGQVLMEGRVQPFAAGQALVLDRKAEAIVLSISDTGVLRTGLPFARFDLLVLAGSHLALNESETARLGAGQVMQSLLALILPACDGVVFTMEGSGLSISGMERLTSARWQQLPPEQGKALSTLMDALAVAELRNASPPESHPPQ